MSATIDVSKFKLLFKYLQDMVYQILRRENVLNSPFSLGIVTSIIDSTHLNVTINGNNTPQKIICSPDISYKIGNTVLIVTLNAIDKIAILRTTI